MTAKNPQIPLERLHAEVRACARCRELRQYCNDVASNKRRAFQHCTYWGRPVTGFGDPHARIVIVGLAPAAHGANRTGRMFTGDRSGDFLYAALHRAGLANQPHAVSCDDGLSLRNIYITAALRCAPPQNKPTPTQLKNCREYLVRELGLLEPDVIICLGAIAWNATLAALRESDTPIGSPHPRFGHAAEVVLSSSCHLLGCYHVSQQNTFTGRLTPPMLDHVLQRAMSLARPRASH